LIAVKTRTDAADNETMPFGLKDKIVVKSGEKLFASVYLSVIQRDVVTFMSNSVSMISTCAFINHQLLSRARARR
jgi:hypothetical protein